MRDPGPSFAAILALAIAGPVVALALVLGAGAPLAAQSFPSDDPVLPRIWQEGMERSHLDALAYSLLDSIGPRLTGTPRMESANAWAVEVMEGWGIDAYNEPYGTWRGWERGITHVDLLEPRVRTLEGTMLAWSPPTDGPVTAEVTVPPAGATAAAFRAWLEDEVPGRFVALDFPPPACRPEGHYEEWGTPGALERFRAERDAARRAFAARLPEGRLSRGDLEAAGAAGILHSNWQGEVGVNRVFGTDTERTPTLDLSCEDYGLLFRLADGGARPVVRVHAQSRDLGEVPVHNSIGVLRGSELPDEYVMLSAHYDSWDAGSGATDNGTGSMAVMEAMRILATVYPNPRRTIMAGLWNGEEQGLNGSRRFVAMHPEVVDGLHALFNMDHSTGRATRVSAQGLMEAGEHFARWFAAIPAEISGGIDVSVPGSPSGGGTDHAAFICAGAPAFSFGASPWGYNPFTWHTNRDTRDKVVLEEIRTNAVLLAMLAYLASEDPARMSRERRAMPAGDAWPQCQPGAERSGG